MKVQKFQFPHCELHGSSFEKEDCKNCYRQWSDWSSWVGCNKKCDDTGFSRNRTCSIGKINYI